MTLTQPATAPVGALVPQMNNGLHRPLPENPVLYTATVELDVLHLSSVVFDIRRDRPLLVCTRPPQGRPPLDVTAAAAELWPICDVVDVLTHEAAQGLCSLLPSWLSVYGGRARLYLPGTDLADDSNAHPLIERESPKPGSYLKKIISTVTRRAREHRRTDPAVLLTDEKKAHARTRDEATRLREEVARLRETDPDTSNDPVFSDPVVQFEHELYLAWLRTVPESDRPDWGLRDYTLGPEFLCSVTQLEGVSRDRIMRACVDVVTGRYPHISGREAKRFKDTVANSGKGKPNLVRADGASAWRLAIGMGATAPRLMWWETDDDIPELSRVAVHNDFRIA